MSCIFVRHQCLWFSIQQAFIQIDGIAAHLWCCSIVYLATLRLLCELLLIVAQKDCLQMIRLECCLLSTFCFRF